MARPIHGRHTSIYLEDTTGASFSMTGDFNSATFTPSVDAPEITSFGDNTMQNLEGGLLNWEFSADGFLKSPDSSACKCTEIINAGGATVLQYGVGGSTSGCPKVTACAILTEHPYETEVNGAATFSISLIPRSGSATHGAWS